MVDLAAARVGGPRAETYLADPAPALAALGVTYTGYFLDGFPAGIHRGLPSGSLTFIVTIDEPLDLRLTPPGVDGTGYFEAMVGGLHRTPAIIRHSGRQLGIQVAVPPLASRALFGVPAAALACATVDLAELLGDLGRSAIDDVRRARSWPARFAALDRALGAAMTRHDRGERHPVRPEVRQAWQRLRASHGLRRIDELADDVGWSRRHLLSQFRGELGQTPKTAARVARFERAQLALRRGGDAATVAASCGYADQAHMVREWNELVGISPSAWLASEAGLVLEA